jgi:hypothetical protein
MNREAEDRMYAAMDPNGAPTATEGAAEAPAGAASAAAAAPARAGDEAEETDSSPPQAIR